MDTRRAAAGDLTRQDFVMFGPDTGRREDPEQGGNIVQRSRDVVNQMFREYVLKDAGGPCRTTSFEPGSVACVSL